MKNIVIRSSLSEYTSVSNYLVNNLNFKDIYISEDIRNIASKKQLLVQLIRDSLSLIMKRKLINNSNIIISIGYINFILIFLNFIGFIKYNKIYWFGFFIHNPKYFKYFKYLFSIINSKKLNIIVFSNYERELYVEKLGLNKCQIHYVPYGNWNKDFDESIPLKDNSDYYFSGGYSNRDYKSLVNVFNKTTKKLIIVGSKLNKELDQLSINKNITILKDIDSNSFDRLVLNAKVCIFPFTFNSGASGQSVMLRCMKYRKIIISTETNVIKEYIDDELSGIILKDISDELLNLLDDIDDNYEKYSNMGNFAYEKYKEKFSYEAISESLKNTIQ